MKKQTVTLLLSLLVVLALLGLMIFLMVRFQSGEEQEEQTVGSSQEETVLMQVAADAINTLSIENPSDSFTLVNEGDGFVVEGLEGVSVSSLNVNNLVDLFAPLTAQRQLLSAEELTVGDSGEQLMQYGLDNPEYIIRIVTTDGAELTLELGDSALDGSSVYALYEGGVYLISDDILDSVSKTRYSFLDNEITEVEPSDYDKAVIELSGTVRPQTITLEIDVVESEEGTESSEDEAVVSSTEKQYTLTTPTVQTITEASASQVTDGLYSLYANQIAAVNPTEEQLAEYGLDEPYSVVSVSIDGVEQFTLRASERNSNNYVYMTKDGSPFVYLVSASRLSWLTVQVEQLTQSVYEPVELEELSSLTVESEDASYSFLVTQGEEQEVQGGPGVPDGAQGGGQIVVAEGEEHPHQDDPQIGGHLAGQVGRGLDQEQDLGQEQLPQDHRGQHAAADEEGGDEQLPAQPGQVLFPKAAGHQYARPHAGAGNHVDIEVHHALGHAQSGQSGFPHVPGDDQGVGDVVQLLEHIGPQQGQRQSRQLGENGTGGEVERLRHGKDLLWEIWMGLSPLYYNGTEK